MEILASNQATPLLSSKALDRSEHCNITLIKLQQRLLLKLTDIKHKEPSCTEPLYLILSDLI